MFLFAPPPPGSLIGRLPFWNRLQNVDELDGCEHLAFEPEQQRLNQLLKIVRDLLDGHPVLAQMTLHRCPVLHHVCVGSGLRAWRRRLRAARPHHQVALIPFFGNVSSLHSLQYRASWLMVVGAATKPAIS